MHDLETAYAGVLAEAIAADIRAHPPGGALIRVILRFHDITEPTYFNARALGEAQTIDAGTAWASEEWPHVDSEDERSQRIEVLPEVKAAGRSLEVYYDSFPDWESLPIPHKDNADVPSPSILVAARLLPVALGDMERVAHFAVATQTWDGGGGRWSLNELCDSRLVAELKARDEWPHH